MLINKFVINLFRSTNKTFHWRVLVSCDGIWLFRGCSTLRFFAIKIVNNKFGQIVSCTKYCIRLNGSLMVLSYSAFTPKLFGSVQMNSGVFRLIQTWTNCRPKNCTKTAEVVSVSFQPNAICGANSQQTSQRTLCQQICGFSMNSKDELLLSIYAIYMYIYGIYMPRSLHCVGYLQ